VTALVTIAVLIGSHLLVLWLIMAAALDGQVTVTEAALYLQGAGGLVNFWFPWHVITLREATRPLAAIDRLPEPPATPATAATDATATGPDAAAPAPLRGDIRFEDVSFAYPERRGQPVFERLDLTIHAGQSLAVVGANGAGKTTLVKLLAGLLEPDAGTVLVGDTPVRDVRRRWQGEVAAIFQDYARYPLSARDNIVVGRDDADPTHVERAVARALARDVIDELPHGLDSPLGREFGGLELSGGQWQRLALARALYAVERGATVLVLDEPTAQLDVRAEAALFDRFLELTHGLTTVLISHRFSSVRHAERIVVLDGGRVIEDGTHAELVAAGGRYARMFAEQAKYFEAVDA
jgi:ATP-binding cassette subfamily B protein